MPTTERSSTGLDANIAGAASYFFGLLSGAVLFAGFLWLCWRAFGRRLWERGYDVPVAARRRTVTSTGQ